MNQPAAPSHSSLSLADAAAAFHRCRRRQRYQTYHKLRATCLAWTGELKLVVALLIYQEVTA
jgi:hypothetical protein